MESNGTQYVDVPEKGFTCNVTLGDKTYLLVGDDIENYPKFCGLSQEYDSVGAAEYAIVTVTVFATAIGFFIGMMSFKKKRYDEWDKQAGAYLVGMYKRRLQEEKKTMKDQTLSMPHMGVIKILSGVTFPADRRNSEYPAPTHMTPLRKTTRSMSSPYKNNLIWQPVTREAPIDCLTENCYHEEQTEDLLPHDEEGEMANSTCSMVLHPKATLLVIEEETSSLKSQSSNRVSSL